MNERFKKTISWVANWALNLSIALSFGLLLLVSWWAVYACCIHPEYWYKFPQLSGNSYQESMQVLRQLYKPNGKN